MKYCPKCGFETEQRDEQGNLLSECPSCGVAWTEFLDLMKDDAFWPSMVRHLKHDLICVQCGYTRAASDNETPRTNCPKCGVVYTSQLVKTPPLQKQKTPIPKQDVEHARPEFTYKTFSFNDRDDYLKGLRENSCYPAFRLVIKVGSVLWYFIAILILVLAVIALFRMGRYELQERGWLVGLGGLSLSLVIAVFTKVSAEAFLMFADAADAIVHSSGKQAK